MEVIQIDQKIVAFVDILGFSKMIEDYDNGKYPELLSIVTDAMNSASDLLTRVFGSEDIRVWKQIFEVKQFSDCLCLSIPLEHHYFSTADHIKVFYQYLCGYQQILLSKGILVRGAISYGSYYANENLIFSGALVECAKLEKATVYPRIHVSPKIIDLLRNKLGWLYDLDLLMTADLEGNLFLNPFNDLLIDAAFSDMMAQKSLPFKGIKGIIVETAFDNALKLKKELLKNIKKKFENHKWELTDPNALMKREWFMKFLLSELGESVGAFRKASELDVLAGHKS